MKTHIKAIIICLAFLFLAIVIIVPAILRIRQLNSRTVCGEHLYEMGKSLHSYAENYGAYPPSNKWCDILLQSKDANETILKCPGNKKAKCGYAMNPNCDPNSKADVILLFDSKGGWNTFGEVEKLSIDNHDGEGAFILYNDGHVSFEKINLKSEFFNELNWGEKSKGRDLK